MPLRPALVFGLSLGLPSLALAASPFDESSDEHAAIEARLDDLDGRLDSVETTLAAILASLQSLEAAAANNNNELISLGSDLYDHNKAMTAGVSTLSAGVAGVATEVDDLAVSVDEGFAATDSAVDARVGDLEADIQALAFALESTRSTVSSIYLGVDDLAEEVTAEVPVLRAVTGSATFFGDDGYTGSISVVLECDENYTLENAYHTKDASAGSAWISNFYANHALVRTTIYETSDLGTDVLQLADPEPPVKAVSAAAGTPIGFYLLPQGDLEDDAAYATGFAPFTYEFTWLVRTLPGATCSLNH